MSYYRTFYDVRLPGDFFRRVSFFYDITYFVGPLTVNADGATRASGVVPLDLAMRRGSKIRDGVVVSIIIIVVAVVRSRGLSSLFP